MYLVEQDLMLRTLFLICCERNNSARQACSPDAGWALGVHGGCFRLNAWCSSLVHFNAIVSRSCLAVSTKMIRFKVLKGFGIQPLHLWVCKPPPFTVGGFLASPLQGPPWRHKTHTLQIVSVSWVYPKSCSSPEWTRPLCRWRDTGWQHKTQ